MDSAHILAVCILFVLFVSEIATGAMAIDGTNTDQGIPPPPGILEPPITEPPGNETSPKVPEPPEIASPPKVPEPPENDPSPEEPDPHIEEPHENDTSHEIPRPPPNNNIKIIHPRDHVDIPKSTTNAPTASTTIRIGYTAANLWYIWLGIAIFCAIVLTMCCIFWCRRYRAKRAIELEREIRRRARSKKTLDPATESSLEIDDERSEFKILHSKSESQESHGRTHDNFSSHAIHHEDSDAQAQDPGSSTPQKPHVLHHKRSDPDWDPDLDPSPYNPKPITSQDSGSHGAKVKVNNEKKSASGLSQQSV